MGKARVVKTNDIFGKLTIIKEVESRYKKRFFTVKCECGTIKDVALGNMVNGGTISCGCTKGTKHGDSRTRLYSIYNDMKLRCSVKTMSNYKNYGGRGITVCDEWLGNNYEVFKKWALENGYEEHLTIDRIEVNGNYESSNCKWATHQEQNVNKRILPTNTSGYTGISWSKKDKVWICVISILNKSKRIGSYRTQKDAVEARNKFIDDNGLNHQKNVYKGELCTY